MTTNQDDGSSQRACLCIFAHPDDEVFRCGGTLALLAQAGARVHVVSLTSGQAGSCGEPPICQPEELGAIRKEELRCACRTLGLDEPSVFDFQDGGLEQSDRSCVEAVIAEKIQSLRPEVIITWPADGLSGHCDHCAASARTKAVFERMKTGNPFLKSLYYLAVPDSIAKRLGMDQLHSTPDNEISVVIDALPVWRQKKAAIMCHRTQAQSSPILAQDEATQQLFLGVEYFEREGNQDGADLLTETYISNGAFL
jgi:LmbE family N-acetylglucosaminyl deacetylase